MFKRAAIALAFSPRIQTLLAEVRRFQLLFDSELIIIHVGTHTEDDEIFLNKHLTEAEIDLNKSKVVWESGIPAKKILSVCKKEKVDILIAGALRKEEFINYYLGSIARRILRKADCSVLMITEPSKTPKPFKKIVVYAENSSYARQAIDVGINIGKLQKANQLHIVREIKLYGLAMSVGGEMTEDEVSEKRKNLVHDEILDVEKELEKIDTNKLKINVKVLSGKSGFELGKFCKRTHADLLVVGSPYRKMGIFDRMFPHDLEYIFADLPCDILIHHPGKSNG